MMNYDVLNKSDSKYLVNTIEAATPTDKYLVQRRPQFDGVKALKQNAMNKPLLKVQKSDYACFFNLKNKQQGIDLSKSLGRIYYFGKYMKNTRIALCYNKMIKNYIQADFILSESTDPLKLEMNLNFNYFRLQDRLRKFTETPYFENGLFKPVRIKQFNLSL